MGVIVIVMVAVFVAVQCQCALGARPEQRAVFLGLRDHLGVAFAADVTVQADHPVRGAHHHMQLMADHQHGTAQPVAQILDPQVELCLRRLVQPGRWLIQNQDLRRIQQRPRQQDPLELPPDRADICRPARSPAPASFSAVARASALLRCGRSRKRLTVIGRVASIRNPCGT